MHYELTLTRSVSGRTIERRAETRAELAEIIDWCLARFPKSGGWEYTVTCVVTKCYTLLDDDVTTGNETQEKLWKFVGEN